MIYTLDPVVKSASVIVLSLILAEIMYQISKKILVQIPSTKRVDTLILSTIRIPIVIFTGLIGLRIGLNILNFQQNATSIQIINTGLIFIVTLAVFRMTKVCIENYFTKLRDVSRIEKSVFRLFKNSLFIIFLFIASMFVLELWGIDVQVLFATLGIAGLAVGLALQNTLSNVIGGITLILDKNFGVGDVIKLEDGQLGEIIDVTLRSTKILTPNNEVLMIPNGTLANSKIVNLALPDKRARAVINIGVDYSSELKKVEKVLLDQVRGIKGILEDPKPLVIVSQLGASSIDLQFIFHLEDFHEKGIIMTEIYHRILTAFRKHKINIPYPTQTVIKKRK